MIKCDLAVVLAKNKLKISKVAEDTGISRTTLTALFYNTCKGVQLDTIDTLCKYFSISLDELFVQTLYDFEIKKLIYKDNTFSFDLYKAYVNYEEDEYSGFSDLDNHLFFDGQIVNDKIILACRPGHAMHYKSINPLFHDDIKNLLIEHLNKVNLLDPSIEYQVVFPR